MSTRNEELHEDYKDAIGASRTHLKVLLLFTGIGGIAAGSKNGFSGSKGMLSWLIGDPSFADFARWYPAVLGLYAIYVSMLYLRRVTLRKEVREVLRSEPDEGMDYRWQDDVWALPAGLRPNWWHPGWSTVVSQVMLLAVPWLSFGMMFIGHSDAAKAAGDFGEPHAVFMGIYAGNAIAGWYVHRVARKSI